MRLVHDATAMAEAKAEKNRSIDLFAVRSVLFLPASNLRAIEKAFHSQADLIVLDLEDAVRPEDKDRARAAAIEAVSRPWKVPVSIRVNGVGTQWHSIDLDAVARSEADLVVIPRATSAHLVEGIATATGRPVLAMIETAAGILAAKDIAKNCAGLIAGTNDLRADLRLPLDSTREPISTALQLVVLAARAEGIAAFDGVFNRLEDLEGFALEAKEGRDLGFDGKSLVHPNQIAPCNSAFSPTAQEIKRAQSLIEAFKGGAERFGNEMIERMHVLSAERLLKRSRN